MRTCVRACVCVAAVRPGLTATPQKSAALHWVALGKQRDCTHCAVIAQPLQEKVKRGPLTHAPLPAEDEPIQLETGEMLTDELFDKVAENLKEAGIGAGEKVGGGRWGGLCQRRSAVFSCSKASGRGLVTESAAPMT